MLGLGNPGARYEDTRHNVGFTVLETLAHRRGFAFRRRLFKPYRHGGVSIGAARLECTKPLTYMNRTGAVVPSLLYRFSVPQERMVVVLDNMDLPCGAVRLKRTGGSSTHNGLRSIGQTLDSFAFPRLYIGIGRPAAEMSVIDHVLGSFSSVERELVDAAVERAATALEKLGEAGFDEVLAWTNAG